MTLKFIHPTAAQVMRFASIALALADFILLYAQQTAALSFIPASLAYLWPYVFGAAFVVHQLASTFGITPDAAVTAQLNSEALIAAHVAGVVAGAKEAMKQAAIAAATPAPVPTLSLRPFVEETPPVS